MNFIIENGMPYLVSNGRAYPVEIRDGTVKYDEERAAMTGEKGRYSLQEVMAKCGRNISSIPKRSRKKMEEL